MNSTKKKKYYSLKNILKYNAQYNILIGQRSNGKSYAVKEKILKDAYNDIGKFVYMRRYKEDIKTSNVCSYFNDMPIEKITNGQYSGVYVLRGIIYFCNYDDDLKPIKGKEIGRAVALNLMESYKSQTFPDTVNLVFEEFVTKKLYIPDEPRELQNFVSTIARDRNISVWMIANTISRVCPYFGEWGLKNIPVQKQGTIDTYEYDRKNVDGEIIKTIIAVENCENAGSFSKMFFGTVSDSITGGSWEVSEVPHIPVDEEGRAIEFIHDYELLFSDMGFNFIVQLCLDPKTGGQWVYVKPYTNTRRIERKITSTFSIDPNITTKFNLDIPAEAIMKQLIDSDKICFSDNLTGNDFIAVLNNKKGGI